MKRDIDDRVQPAPLEAAQTVFCRRCRAVGTIVQLGMCCRVADLLDLDAVSELFRALPARRVAKNQVPPAWLEAA